MLPHIDWTYQQLIPCSSKNNNGEHIRNSLHSWFAKTMFSHSTFHKQIPVMYSAHWQKSQAMLYTSSLHHCSWNWDIPISSLIRAQKKTPHASLVSYQGQTEKLSIWNIGRDNQRSWLGRQWGGKILTILTPRSLWCVTDYYRWLHQWQMSWLTALIELLLTFLKLYTGSEN